MDNDQGTTIRSFAIAFDIERRLYKLDRWRLPLAHGLPVRTLAYAAAALLAILVVGRLPLLGQVIHALPPPLRILLLPGTVAHLLSRVEIDGRPAHRCAVSWLRLQVQPQRLVAFRSGDQRPLERLGTVTVIPDELAGNSRAAIVEGPARVLIRYPARARIRGRTLVVEMVCTQPLRARKQLTLGPGQRLLVR
ncbi:MAG: hypothetical protein NVSMB25_05260 [Thermoleophilaceae bacterium]